MRDRPHAEIPDPAEDNNRDSDAPTQLWSGRLSLSSITPRLRAARRRQRLEALLNTQTGITFEVAPEMLEAASGVNRSEPKSERQHQSSNPPTVVAPPAPSSMSGPQLAIFVAVGVAVGGMAALHMDHLLHPFARHPRDVNSEQQVAQHAPAVAIQPGNQRLASEATPRSDVAPLQVAAAPQQQPRSLAPKLRSQTTEGAVQVQANGPATAVATPAARTESRPEANADPRVPTQLHPRVNPLMTSNQVFRDK